MNWVLLGTPDAPPHALAQALRQHLACDSLRLVCATVPWAGEPALRPEAAPYNAVHTCVADCLQRCPGPRQVLVMGLDPWQPPSPVALAADSALRAALQALDMSYHVIYGHGEQVLLQALSLIKIGAPHPGFTTANGLSDLNPEVPPSRSRRREWDCEKCSDPVCEHRLFTALLRDGARHWPDPTAKARALAAPGETQHV